MKTLLFAGILFAAGCIPTSNTPQKVSPPCAPCSKEVKGLVKGCTCASDNCPCVPGECKCDVKKCVEDCPCGTKKK